MFEDDYRYICDKCKRVFFTDCEGADTPIRFCPACGNMGVSKCVCTCNACHKPLYEGDGAYKIGKTIYCTDCVKELEI